MTEKIIDNETTKVLVLTAKQVEKMELDHEDDLKDEICSRLGIRKCTLLYTGWNGSNRYYVAGSEGFEEVMKYDMDRSSKALLLLIQRNFRKLTN